MPNADSPRRGSAAKAIDRVAWFTAFSSTPVQDATVRGVSMHTPTTNLVGTEHKTRTQTKQRTQTHAQVSADQLLLRPMPRRTACFFPFVCVKHKRGAVCGEPQRADPYQRTRTKQVRSATHTHLPHGDTHPAMSSSAVSPKAITLLPAFMKRIALDVAPCTRSPAGSDQTPPTRESQPARARSQHLHQTLNLQCGCLVWLHKCGVSSQVARARSTNPAHLAFAFGANGNTKDTSETWSHHPRLYLQ